MVSLPGWLPPRSRELPQIHVVIAARVIKGEGCQDSVGGDIELGDAPLVLDGEPCGANIHKQHRPDGRGQAPERRLRRWRRARGWRRRWRTGWLRAWRSAGHCMSVCSLLPMVAQGCMPEAGPRTSLRLACSQLPAHLRGGRGLGGRRRRRAGRAHGTHVRSEHRDGELIALWCKGGWGGVAAGARGGARIATLACVLNPRTALARGGGGSALRSGGAPRQIVRPPLTRQLPRRVVPVSTTPLGARVSEEERGSQM